MSIRRVFATLSIFLLANFCWAGEASRDVVDNEKFGQILNEGAQLAQARKLTEAIPYFDKVIAGYEDAYKGEDAKLYCARGQAESLMYLLESASTQISAKVVSSNWAYAYYMKAYSLLDLGRVSEAKVLLEKAIELSPRNSQFLSELGNLYQRERNWPKALETFHAAEDAAREFSPQNMKNIELSRAWRGLGFVYVEQGKFDDAERMYRQCLELDSKDTRAMNELRYIQGVKAKLAPK